MVTDEDLPCKSTRFEVWAKAKANLLIYNDTFSVKMNNTLA